MEFVLTYTGDPDHQAFEEAHLAALYPEWQVTKKTAKLYEVQKAIELPKDLGPMWKANEMAYLDIDRPGFNMDAVRRMLEKKGWK